MADSNRGLSYKNESFANLHGFRNAIDGQSCSITENINDTKMILSYHPIDAVSKSWAILIIQHNGDAAADDSIANFSLDRADLSKQKQ